jgi:hypothetical protein
LVQGKDVPRRNWWKAPGKFLRSFGDPGPASLLGIGGLAIGVVASWIAVPVGLTFLGGSALWAGFKSWPPKYNEPSDLLGKDLTLDELKEVDPPVFKLGLVGPSESGKTTLLSRIGHQKSPRPEDRTQRVYARIFAVNKNPLGFLAVLDGSGLALHQQFKLIEHADFLCIVLDHHQADDVPIFEESRLKKHDDFLDQVQTYMLENKNEVKYINILLNKKDLWQNRPENAPLLTWFDHKPDAWKKTFPKIDVKDFKVSNNTADDVVALEERISEAYADFRAKRP